ncbi:MAG: hypothetical protein QOG03_698 [Actinomycetota bacterium]|nr:hypothetical protein [Actinomycetota bacterium]
MTSRPDDESRSIAYVVDGFPVLSQTFIQNELRELARLGIRPHVFSLYDPTGLDASAGDLAFTRLLSPTKHPGAFIRAAARVARRRPGGLGRTIALALRRPSRLQLHALGRAIVLIDALGSSPPARLHAHFARASASTALLAAAGLRCRFSFTAHANDIFQGPFDVERKLQRADLVVTVCQYNRRRIEAQWPGLARRLVVIPCGVQVDRFRRHHPYRRDPFTIVGVSRLEEKKAFDDLVRACARLRDGGLAFRCRIIGEGTQRPLLERLIAELDLGALVTLEGAMTQDEIREVLEEASVFCLPCVVASNGDLDSQPVVVKEALAMEIPCVVTDEVGNPEMVDAEVGRLVPTRDPAALADALLTVSRLPEAELLVMGRAARKRVEERFSLAQLAAELAASWAESEGAG